MPESFRTRKKNTNILISLTAIWIIISIYIISLNALIGFSLIFFAIVVLALWLRSGNPSEEKHISDTHLQMISRQDKNRGRTIYVQIVDDNGNDLPEEVIQQKLYEAHRSAEPRDTIVSVHHKINT